MAEVITNKNMFRAPSIEAYGSGSNAPVRRLERPAECPPTVEEEDRLIARYFSVEKVDRQLRHEALIRWVDSGLAETLGFYAFLGWDGPPAEISSSPETLTPEVQVAA